MPYKDRTSLYTDMEMDSVNEILKYTVLYAPTFQTKDTYSRKRGKAFQLDSNLLYRILNT